MPVNWNLSDEDAEKLFEHLDGIYQMEVERLSNIVSTNPTNEQTKEFGYTPEIVELYRVELKKEVNSLRRFCDMLRSRIKNSRSNNMPYHKGPPRKKTMPKPKPKPKPKKKEK